VALLIANVKHKFMHVFRHVKGKMYIGVPIKKYFCWAFQQIFFFMINFAFSINCFHFKKALHGASPL